MRHNECLIVGIEVRVCRPLWDMCDVTVREFGHLIHDEHIHCIPVLTCEKIKDYKGGGDRLDSIICQVVSSDMFYVTKEWRKIGLPFQKKNEV